MKTKAAIAYAAGKPLELDHLERAPDARVTIHPRNLPHAERKGDVLGHRPL